MIKDDIQKQIAGNNSANLQAKGNITINNNNYYINSENAKDELLQIFKENILHLRKIAAETAQQRAEELNNLLLEEITNQDKTITEKIFKRMADPDWQVALFEAQKNHAKYNDETRLKNFIHCLINKGLEDNNSLNNLLIDKAISVLAKMNKDQINFLSYLVNKHTDVPNITTNSDLYDNYLKKILVYSHVLNVLSYPDIDYLDLLGVLKLRPYQIIDYTIEDIIKKRYKLSPDYSNEDIKTLLIQDKKLQNIELTHLGIFIGQQNIAIQTIDKNE